MLGRGGEGVEEQRQDACRVWWPQAKRWMVWEMDQQSPSSALWGLPRSVGAFGSGSSLSDLSSAERELGGLMQDLEKCLEKPPGHWVGGIFRLSPL